MADSSTTTTGSSTLVGEDSTDERNALRDKNKNLIALLKSNQYVLLNSFKDALDDDGKRRNDSQIQVCFDRRNQSVAFDEVVPPSQQFPNSCVPNPRPEMHKSITTYTSTPRSKHAILRDSGNIRNSFNSKPIKVAKENDLSYHKSSSRRSMTKKDKTGKMKSLRPQVRFASNDLPHFITTNDQSQPSTSMLGYDWIAGRLENDSILEKTSEQYFEEIRDFRRVFRKECISSNENRENFQTTEDEFITDSNAPLSKKCNGMYMINDRLCPVPIHGPNDNCQICKTKLDSQSEYDGSYVRVSVPRSTLVSPYKIKPHRRSSYDPSDTVALSKHCLAGWQHSHLSSAKNKDVIDLQSHLSNSERSGNTTLKYGMLCDANRYHSRQTEDLLDATLTLRHDAHRLSNRHHHENHSSLAL